ncbi:uncharacterized protein LOC115992672 isoform X2 [Quercus lobata]|uniref:Plant bHLH transcription factor ACT-like domain-containing protein n=1 Tax=Quercus lobata TaxID=97700 RepID=A0A7N2LRQ7_QUELO|nr:uncharacterized protein LOC115992672 isoform X2 [Quercus lobata]
MASMLQKRIAMRRKIHILRAQTKCSKSVKRSFINTATLLYIYKLILKLEAIKREYLNLMATKKEYLKLMKNMQDVEVQKLMEGFLVKVNCEKGEDRLVIILEAFDEMGLNVQQARVSSNKRFEMEAIVVAQDQALDVKEVTEALLGALKRKLEMRHYTQEA